jgi:multidrug efflux system outer membrane protein
VVTSIPFRVLAIGPVLFLAGCVTVGPDYSRPDLALSSSFGATHSTAKSVTPTVRWWTGFGDPVLNRLIETGLAQNLTVQEAVERVIQARFTAQATGASGLPSLSGSIADTVAGVGSSNSTNTFTSGFDASWEIDLFGGIARNREAAKASLEAAIEDTNAARLTLIGEIADAYVDIRGYQARIVIATQTLAAQKATLSLTVVQQQGGTGSGLATAQAAAATNSTAADIPTLEMSLQQSIHKLGVLLGEQPQSLAAALNAGPGIPTARASVAAGVPADLVRDRPDVREAERNLAAATADIGVAEANLYPSITLSGSVSAAVTSATMTSWSFGPSINIPIFNGGKLRAEVNLEQSKAREQYLTYKGAVLSAMQDVEDGLVGLKQEQIRHSELAKSVVNYGKALDLAKQQYGSGSTSFSDVLTAQKSLYSAQDAVAASSVNLATDYIALCKALGGGWDLNDAKSTR